MASKKYSPTQKDTIYAMIHLDPNRRLLGEEIVKIAQEEIQKQKSSNKIDKSFIMEDIYFKLSLMHYEKLFCKPLKTSKISRWEFCDEEEEFSKHDKFQIFSRLTKWQSEMIKSGNYNQQAIDFEDISDKKKIAQDLMQILKSTAQHWYFNLLAMDFIFGSNFQKFLYFLLLLFYYKIQQKNLRF